MDYTVNSFGARAGVPDNSAGAGEAAQSMGAALTGHC
jgi:hypothetical protein